MGEAKPIKPRPKNSNLVLSLLALYIGYVVYSSLSDGNIPEVPDSYWGNQEIEIDDATISSFKINAEESSSTSQLESKLEQEFKSDGQKPVGNENIDMNLVQKIAQYWKDSYKWNERVKLLNKYPHFTTVINGLKIHFQRVKVSDGFHSGNVSITGKNPRPLLLLHGWPSSFTEFQKIIPLLLDTDRIGFPFELIIPSLPGFGYSEGSTKPGLGSVAISQVFLKLMQRLGHENFYVHGANDFGSGIATTMATVYPVNVVGIHLHQCISRHPKSLVRHVVTAALSYFIMASEESLRATRFYLEPSGASGIAKPDTMSVALANSPTGLLSYILEMSSQNSNGENGEAVNVDDTLDNVMVYWLTNSIVSSSKIFANQLNSTERAYNLESVTTFVPTMCTSYPNNAAAAQQSESYLSDKYAQILRLHEERQQSPTTIANNIIESFILLERKGFAGFDRKHTCHVKNLASLQ